MTQWTYEVHVNGDVDDRILSEIRAEFGNVTATVEPASTVMSSDVPDQAALIGMLTRLQDLGLKVHEVRRLVEPAG